jgi:hypothetical protein
LSFVSSSQHRFKDRITFFLAKISHFRDQEIEAGILEHPYVENTYTTITLMK